MCRKGLLFVILVELLEVLLVVVVKLHLVVERRVVVLRVKLGTTKTLDLLDVELGQILLAKVHTANHVTHLVRVDVLALALALGVLLRDGLGPCLLYTSDAADE